jgi:hypothetical protein
MAHDRDLPQLAVETALPKRAQKRRGQAGQTLPMMMFFMVSLLGVAGLVIDVGGWYLQKRQVQAAADASALAGANQLPAGWSYGRRRRRTSTPATAGRRQHHHHQYHRPDRQRLGHGQRLAGRAGLPDARVRAVGVTVSGSATATIESVVGYASTGNVMPGASCAAPTVGRPTR